MWNHLDNALAVLLMIGLPLIWGLAVECIFELRRRRKASTGEKEHRTP